MVDVYHVGNCFGFRTPPPPAPICCPAFGPPVSPSRCPAAPPRWSAGICVAAQRRWHVVAGGPTRGSHHADRVWPGSLPHGVERRHPARLMAGARGVMGGWCAGRGVCVWVGGHLRARGDRAACRVTPGTSARSPRLHARRSRLASFTYPWSGPRRLLSLSLLRTWSRRAYPGSSLVRWVAICLPCLYP